MTQQNVLDEEPHRQMDHPDHMLSGSQATPAQLAAVTVLTLLALAAGVVLPAQQVNVGLSAEDVGGAIAWFAIPFTGRYPRGLFDYVVGVGRWALRVEAYATLLITDRYPPFSLQ